MSFTFPVVFENDSFEGDSFEGDSYLGI